MPFNTLSSVAQAIPAVINSSLEKLSCSARGIDEVDIYPAVLSALTANGAPHGVAADALAVVRAARLNRSHKLKDGAGAQARKREDSYMASFNVGIAMSLHTVLLSRNRIGNLLGIVQFKHCVRLSLLGNRIRTIESCEPLALLPDLQYLSLEFNPVAQLSHYRAHLLRICAWPHELSAQTCRLRKLDSTAVTSAEVKHAVLCLQREQTLLPELLYRMQLLAFLGDMEKRNGLHRELRQRGWVFQQTADAVTLDATLERCAAYALARVPVSGAAHLVRLLVRDRHRLSAGQSVADRPFSKCHAEQKSAAASPAPSRKPAYERKARSTPEHASEVDLKDAAATVDAPSTPTFFGSDQLDDSHIASVSSVASCSFLPDHSDDDIQAMHSLSNLLGAKELDWSRAALRRADALAAKETCKEWSWDTFRQALAFLDVRICAVLLRLARGLGQSLSTHDVDRLCQVWLHAVTHCAPTEELALNATGPRRLVSAVTVTPRRKPKTQLRGTEKVIEVRSPALNEQGGAYEGNQRRVNGSACVPPPQPCPSGRLPVDAVAQVTKNVWDVGEQDACLSNTLSSLPVVSSGVSDDCTDISMTSLLSTDSPIQPRKTIPVPTAANGHMAPRALPSEQVQQQQQQNAASPSPSQVPEATHKTSSSDVSLALAEKMFRRQVKQRAFQQWCTSLRHRWQSRIATVYIRDKINEAVLQPRLECVRGPAWSGLLQHVTYIERKRGYFNCWRRRAGDKREARAKELERVSEAWRAQSGELASLSSSHRQQGEEKDATAATRRSTTQNLFHAWKVKAEQKALSRCTTARQRLLAETPHTPETFLSLHPRSATVRAALRVKSPLSSPVMSRHQLEELLQTTGKPQTDEDGSAPPSSPSPTGGFRRCDLAHELPVKVTKWQAASTPASAQGHKDAAAHMQLDEDEGRLSVAPSSSDGISVNSVTTPFLADQHFSQAHGRVETSSTYRSPQEGHPQSAGVLRELSPPPAIRILFPTDNAAGSCACSPPAPTSRSRSNGNIGIALPQSASSPMHPPRCSVGGSMAGNFAVRLRGCPQPSRLPSTTTARRAIIASSTRPSSHSAPRLESSVRHTAHSDDAACPYPAEDVEALVARAKQLEADRVFLLAEVRRLSLASQRNGEAFTPTPDASPKPCLHADEDCRSPMQDDAEERRIAQQCEIKRLESIVVALRDERHSLLRSVKTEIFQY
ncbi:hypothetical protein ABB37_03507 [Leptomonas pyrrhocoris]|uniref:Uncharacterized protein n=1 Tax=Leptomonas pyrrhocoris TaxID=157538 RepID=A0A0M9G4U0_LEPPY|nr:hypothetical protein ABB37_03507 [Leptomonas pyrrhocoris]KPA82440.1 hypothetical protein ABB37_03507 [Leptomonas pyrrhocoris]|eukprot:XP_015660879.1 hypothetical protein ABB37_03507 [Leptomonas pyrrhocoris]